MMDNSGSSFPLRFKPYLYNINLVPSQGSSDLKLNPFLAKEHLLYLISESVIEYLYGA